MIHCEVSRIPVISSEDDIRIKGTRVGTETVLDDYLTGSSPEEIAARYRSLSIEQVYATITYYFHNRAQVDAYLEAWREYTDQAWEDYNRNPSEKLKNPCDPWKSVSYFLK